MLSHPAPALHVAFLSPSHRSLNRSPAISDEFMAALERHSWPGNVRALQNFIEQSVILATGAVPHGLLSEFTDTRQEDSKSGVIRANHAERGGAFAHP
jgi:transcriptional regulator with PAS, ATPase and Fis domain